MSGATLIRAKPNQIRAVSKREEMEAMTEGTAVLRTPVTLNTFLQGFKGRHYLDVTGDVPSERHKPTTLPPRTKRKASSDEPEQLPARPEEDEKGGDPAPAETVITEGLIPKTPLKLALERDPNTLDGAVRVEKKKKEPPQGASGSNSCPVDQCQLPGHHAIPHEGRQGRFLIDEMTGQCLLVDDDGQNVSSSSTSSTLSESELMPDEDHKVLYHHGANMVNEKSFKSQKETKAVPVFYALEMEVTNEEADWLAKHPPKAAIWLSKKMEAKGKQEAWNQLSLDRKKDFDLAQAKELSQVLASRALRSLTRPEELNLDKSTVMNMRWVLTTKGGGTAKARLVVLGFQAHNLTEVETASPTMSKIGRQMLFGPNGVIGFCLEEW